MLSKIIAEDLISRVREAIDVKNNIVITCHVGPDGDAIGSSLALWHYLRGLGKKATVVTPNGFPDFLAWMPGADDILTYDRERERVENTLFLADLIFCLDFNTTNRLDRLESVVLNAAAPKILIDHHLYPDPFAQLIISHPEISSTSELIFRMICRLGHYDRISVECAQCIYTGMMTDTGGFSYNSNQPEIYSIIGELLKIGIDKDDIYRKVFNTYSLNRLKLNAYCIYRKMKVYNKWHTALIALSREELEKFYYRQGDTEGVVNTPLSIDGVVFSVFMREDTDKIKISLRSQGTFPANKVAADLFGGGGHLNAAGGESYLTLEETVDKFRKALPSYGSLLRGEQPAAEKSAKEDAEKTE